MENEIKKTSKVGGYRPGSGRKKGVSYIEKRKQVSLYFNALTTAKLAFLAKKAGMKKSKLLDKFINDHYLLTLGTDELTKEE